ncbi:hypothetical protein IAD21_00261 [Abditibacteriota bacterium]|nr:hypothetical protein IAD21_00261 [Abditibacteriota bacterium]
MKNSNCASPRPVSSPPIYGWGEKGSNCHCIGVLNFYKVLVFAIYCLTIPVFGATPAPLQVPVKPELTLQIAHSEEVTVTAFSADGKRLITGSDDGTLKWWNIQRSELLVTTATHQGPLYSLRMSPEGETVASAGRVGGVKFWNARTGGLMHTLVDESESVCALAFSSDGHTFACIRDANEMTEVVIWDTRNWRVQRSFQILEPTSALALSPDGSLVAVGGRDSKMAGVWETRAAKLRFLLSDQDVSKPVSSISALSFVPQRRGASESLLATVNIQWLNNKPHSRVKLWNTTTGRYLYDVTQTETYLREIAFSPDGTTLALGEEVGSKATVNLWELEGKVMSQSLFRQSISLPDIRLRGITFSPDSHSLATGGSQSYPTSRMAWVFDARTGELSSQVTALRNYNAISSASLVGEQLVMIGDTASQEWDAVAGTTRQIKQHSGDVLSPDNKFFAHIYNDEVRIEDAKSGQLLHSLRGEKGVQSAFLLFSPDSQILLSRDSETVGNFYHHPLNLWDVHTGKRLQKVDITAYSARQSNSVAFSPDSKLLAVGGGGLVQLWDVTTGKMHLELSPPIQGPQEGPVVFSRDGRYVAATVRSKSDDLALSSIQVWELPSGKLIQQLSNPGERATALAFSANNALLAVGSKYGEIDLWNVTTGILSHKLEGHSNQVNSVAFSDSGTGTNLRLVSGGTDGTAKIWDTANGKLLATCQILRNQWSDTEPERLLRDWIVYTPDGDYQASAEASLYIRWRLGDDLLDATAYQATMFRPNLLQQVLAGE